MVVSFLSAALSFSFDTDARWPVPSRSVGTRPPSSRSLATSFGSHMVLHAMAASLWGFGSPNEAVSVTVQGQLVARATVAANGTWSASLPPQPPTVNQSLGVSIVVTVGGHSETLTDVLFGEVWLGSGQSNMAFTVAQGFNASAECEDAVNHPQIRLFTARPNFDYSKYHPNRSALDFNASEVYPWQRPTSDSVCGGYDFDRFSAVAFYFCRELQRKCGCATRCRFMPLPNTHSMKHDRVP